MTSNFRENVAVLLFYVFLSFTLFNELYLSKYHLNIMGEPFIPPLQEQLILNWKNFGTWGTINLGYPMFHRTAPYIHFLNFLLASMGFNGIILSKIYFFALTILPGFFMFLFIKEILKNNISAFFGSFIYQYSQIVYYQLAVSHYIWLIGYTLTPLILLFLYRYLLLKKFKYLLMSALLFSFLFQIQLYPQVLILSLLLCICYLKNINIDNIVKYVVFPSALFIVLFTTIQAQWVLVNSIFSEFKEYYFSKAVTINYILNTALNPVHAIFLNNIFFTPEVMTNNNVWLLVNSYLIILILSFSSLLFLRSEKNNFIKRYTISVFCLLLFIYYLLFSLKVEGLASLTKFLFSNFFVFKFFRTLTHLKLTAFFVISLLFSYTLARISEKVKWKHRIALLILFLFFGIMLPLIFTFTTMNNALPKYSFENEKKIYNILEEKDNYSSGYRILNIPMTSLVKYSTTQPVWSRNIFIWNLPGETYDISPMYRVSNVDLLSYYLYTLINDQKNEVLLSKLLGFTSTRYAIIDTNISPIFNHNWNTIFENLNKLGYNIIYSEDNHFILESKLVNPPVKVVYGNFILVDIPLLDMLAGITSMQSYPVIADYPIPHDISSILNNAQIIITKNTCPYFLSIFYKESNIIYPQKYKEPIEDPNSYFASIQQTWWNVPSLTKYLKDYIIYTKSNKAELKIPINCKTLNKTQYKLFVEYLSTTSWKLEIYRKDGTKMCVKVPPSNTLRIFTVILNGTTIYNVTHICIFKDQPGILALGRIILVPEKIQKSIIEKLQNKTIVYLFEAESDLYRDGTKTIKGIEFSNGAAVIFDESGKVWQNVEIVKNGTYRLALRGTGEFVVKIGDKFFILKSNNLNFTYSPPFYLTKGKYKLEIIPLKLNVKNLVKNPSFEKIFAGLPKDWKIGNTNFKISFDKGYEGRYSLKVSTSSTEKGTWSWIRSEPIDVEPGKEYLIITHMKVRNAKASHIPIEAYFADKKRWKQLIQVPSGKSGTSDWKEFKATIKIPENVTKIRVVLNAGWVLDRSKGEAVTWFDDIQVIPLDEAPKLDVIWLYSSNKTIDQLFEVKEKPAKVVSYEKINPTLWKVKVNAKKPFMLSFAEAYDPLWEARIYKNGKLVEKVKSIPLYSVINGFWINETGNLTIVIRYTPQDWFELGLKISALTFIGCIGYLFYDWRREKGDKWAKEIERKVKEWLRRK